MNGGNISIDKDVMSEILGESTKGINFMRQQLGSGKFLEVCGRLDDINIKNVNKKALKSEFQLLFELVNKSFLPRSEKRTVAAGSDLFLMEDLSKFKKFIFPAIVIEYMHTLMTAKYGKHGLAYGF